VTHYKCNSCGGTYHDVQGGGVYYHACPEYKMVGKNKVPIKDRRNENIIAPPQKIKESDFVSANIEGQKTMVLKPELRRMRAEGKGRTPIK